MLAVLWYSLFSHCSIFRTALDNIYLVAILTFRPNTPRLLIFANRHKLLLRVPSHQYLEAFDLRSDLAEVMMISHLSLQKPHHSQSSCPKQPPQSTPHDTGHSRQQRHTLHTNIGSTFGLRVEKIGDRALRSLYNNRQHTHIWRPTTSSRSLPACRGHLLPAWRACMRMSTSRCQEHTGTTIASISAGVS